MIRKIFNNIIERFKTKEEIEDRIIEIKEDIIDEDDLWKESVLEHFVEANKTVEDESYKEFLVKCERANKEIEEFKKEEAQKIFDELAYEGAKEPMGWSELFELHEGLIRLESLELHRDMCKRFRLREYAKLKKVKIVRNGERYDCYDLIEHVWYRNLTKDEAIQCLIDLEEV